MKLYPPRVILTQTTDWCNLRDNRHSSFHWYFGEPLVKFNCLKYYWRHVNNCFPPFHKAFAFQTWKWLCNEISYWFFVNSSLLAFQTLLPVPKIHVVCCSKSWPFITLFLLLWKEKYCLKVHYCTAVQSVKFDHTVFKSKAECMISSYVVTYPYFICWLF